MELAKIVNEPVLAMPLEATAMPVESLKSVPVAAVQPTGEEIPVAQVVEAPPATLVAQVLPHTASSLPLFALIGVLSLVASLTLLIVAKRSV